nr:DUF87 domain-containing protein [Azospirillum sp. SYSU D00513]
MGAGVDAAPIYWDASRVMNGHFTIVGPSGSGKTTRLRRLMAGMSLINPDVRFIFLDPHGDMRIQGESVVRFSETANVGLNPLRISEDPDFGGVRKRVKFFLSLMNRFGRQLGDRQVYAVESLLTDLYAKAGFLADEPETWSLEFDPRRGAVNRKRYPTVADLRKFAQHKLLQVFLGTSSECVHALDDLSKRFKDEEQSKEARTIIEEITGAVRQLEGTREAVSALEELNKRVQSMQRALQKEAKGQEGPTLASSRTSVRSCLPASSIPWRVEMRSTAC